MSNEVRIYDDTDPSYALVDSARLSGVASTTDGRVTVRHPPGAEVGFAVGPTGSRSRATRFLFLVTASSASGARITANTLGDDLLDGSHVEYAPTDQTTADTELITADSTIETADDGPWWFLESGATPRALVSASQNGVGRDDVWLVAATIQGALPTLTERLRFDSRVYSDVEPTRI